MINSCICSAFAKSAVKAALKSLLSLVGSGIIWPYIDLNFTIILLGIAHTSLFDQLEPFKTTRFPSPPYKKSMS
jgi:hypothetical protein